MHKIICFFLPLFCAACVSSGVTTQHYLMQDTQRSFEEGVTKNFSQCAPIAFAEAEAHLIMAAHEFSEGNMDRSYAQALKQKADAFMQQAQQKCAPVATSKPEPKVMKVIKKEVVQVQDSFKETVYFKTNQSELSTLAVQRLAKVVQRILDKKHISIMLYGHTDERGKRATNQNLSCARSNVVAAYFVTSGISKHHIHSHCYGESQPVATGEHEKAWQKNRRVEIHISKQENKKQTTDKAEKDGQS